MAGGASLEMGAHAGDRRVGAGAGELELYVAVELLEALLAAELGPVRTQKRTQQPFVFVRRQRSSSPSSIASATASPRSARRERSLWRAS